MGAEQKREVLDLVQRSPLSKRNTLAELGIPRSTYYRWQRRFRQQGEVGLVDRWPQPGTVWNRLTPQEEEKILREALRQLLDKSKTLVVNLRIDAFGNAGNYFGRSMFKPDGECLICVNNARFNIYCKHAQARIQPLSCL